MRVLLIEQDKLAAQLYAEALGAKGFSVRVADTAQKALFALDEEIPSCIVLELELKRHNGFEFLYEFCSQDDWKHVPIIVHTNINPRRLEKFHVDWNELNVIEYLYKPKVKLSDLQNSVVSAATILIK